MDDFNAWAFKNLRTIRMIFSASVWSLVNGALFFAKRVPLGKKCKFYGRTLVERKIHSQISVGERCTFRSTSYSNLIGISRPCILATHAEGASILIGRDCGFSGTVIGAFKSIKIGDHVRCGANTLITDGDWHTGDSRTGAPAEVIIGDNVWLGVNVIVLKGVKIGKNSVIGAGSVVVHDVPENVMAAGNPCQTIKELQTK